MKRTRTINSMLALIPEWVVAEYNLNKNGRKVGNAYILSSKDLSGIEGDFFEHKVAILGGLTISDTTAVRLINGTLKPITFNEPIEREVKEIVKEYISPSNPKEEIEEEKEEEQPKSETKKEEE